MAPFVLFLKSLLVMILLLIASSFGYQKTAINYDILTYLPQNLQSIQGQRILDEEFHNASIGRLILEGTDQDAEKLREKMLAIDGIEEVGDVEDVVDVLSKSSVVGEMLPKEILPVEILPVDVHIDYTLNGQKIRCSRRC